MESLLIKALNSQDKSEELKFMEKLYNDDVNISVLTTQMEILQVLLKDGDYFCFDGSIVKIKELPNPGREMIKEGITLCKLILGNVNGSYNVYRLHALKFIHACHKGVLPETFNHFFQYASNVHIYNTRYGAKQNLHKFRVKTNTGKQMISYMAIDLWQELPYKFKDLNQFAFSKSVKNYIVSQQYQT